MNLKKKFVKLFKVLNNNKNNKFKIKNNQI